MEAAWAGANRQLLWPATEMERVIASGQRAGPVGPQLSVVSFVDGLSAARPRAKSVSSVRFVVSYVTARDR